MLDEARRYIFKDVELNWPKLVTPQWGYGKQEKEWSVQIAPTDKEEAKRWKENHLKPKFNEDTNKWYVELKRKVKRANGEENSIPVVVDHAVNELDATKLGNGSKGNIEVFQFPYEMNGNKGVSTRLEGVQVDKFVVYEKSVGFQPVSQEGSDNPKTEGFTPVGKDASADKEEAKEEPKKVVNKKKKGGDPPSAEDLVKDWE